MSYKVSKKELVNAVTVFDLLNQIPNISFTQIKDRPDLFEVSEFETGLDAIIDVEDDIVVTFINIENVPVTGLSAKRANDLLRANSSAVHGGFSITDDNKLVFKSTLEIENLDFNELEASITSVFGNSYKLLELLSSEQGEL